MNTPDPYHPSQADRLPERPITRRHFLQSAAAGLAAACLAGVPGVRAAKAVAPLGAAMLGRITRAGVRVYREPDEKSSRVVRLERDALVPLLEMVTSGSGPAGNPRWYRVAEGFLHSGPVQRVDDCHTNPPVSQVPAGGLLAQVTVPWSQATYRTRAGYETPLYRLYLGSVHWVTGLEEDSSGAARYVLTDDWLRVRYSVPASDLRPLDPTEYAPLPEDKPGLTKRLVVSLSTQTLTAFEGREQIYETRVSTGKKYMETPAGSWQIDRKYPSRHMGDGALTADLRAYELPGVPWATFFHEAGIAFHGTYWHDNFGIPTSHGCVNLTIPDALWIFRWTAPAYPGPQGDAPVWKVTGKSGTRVEIVD